MDNTEKKSYTTKEVAQLFGTNEDAIRRLYRSGELKSKENGYRSKKEGLSFTDEEISRYLKSHPDSRYESSVKKKINAATAITLAIASGTTVAVTPLIGIAQSIGLIAAALLAKSISKDNGQSKSVRKQLEKTIMDEKESIAKLELEIDEKLREIENRKSCVVELEYLLEHMDEATLNTEIAEASLNDAKEKQSNAFQMGQT